MLLKHDETFVLVIDVQEKLAPAIVDIERVKKNIAALLTAADRLSVPVIVTEHCADKIGHTVPSLKALVRNDAVVHKRHFSAQAEPDIADRLASMNRKKVIVAGTESHVCVLQTTLDMVEAGYDAYLMVDGTSSRYRQDKDTAIHRMSAKGVEPVTLEMVLFEWLERGDTALFQELLPLIRDR
jgi:nicotinamidase-related amidase